MLVILGNDSFKEMLNRSLMHRTAIFTIVSNNYLHFARTLLGSVRQQHPECSRYCVVVDQDYFYARELDDEFKLITLDDLSLPDLEKFMFRYNIVEVNTAVKPWAFSFLADKNYTRIVYMDPDIYLYTRMTEIFKALDDGANAVLTPHLLAPMNDDRYPGDIDILRSGTYNLGFLAVRYTQETRAMLSWWKSKLEYQCVADVEQGLFVDQKWMDLAPGLFPGIMVLRHQGYNVAYWNLAQRKVVATNDHYLVNGQPLVFFHFSGFSPTDPTTFSKHQNRFMLDELGDVKQIALEYAKTVVANDLARYSILTYGYSSFEDGTPITDPLRRMYRQDGLLQEMMGDNPFANPDVFMQQVPALAHLWAETSWAEYAAWNARPDLQRAFPLTNSEHAIELGQWFVAGGETLAPKRFLEVVRSRLTTIKNRPRNASSPGLGIGEQNVSSIYTHLLQRVPDMEALRCCAPRCVSWLGNAMTALAVFFSRESRAKGLGFNRWCKLVSLIHF